GPFATGDRPLEEARRRRRPRPQLRSPRAAPRLPPHHRGHARRERSPPGGSRGMILGKLGVIGDIHAEDRRLETALRWMKKLAVDRVLAVGDLADGYGDLERCCRLLREADALV